MDVVSTVTRAVTANNNTIYLFTTAAYALCIAAVPILTPRHGQEGDKGQVVGDGHAALEDEVLQGLEQGHQQVGQHDHRQGEDHDPHVPRQLEGLLHAALPQGARQGGEEGGPERREELQSSTARRLDSLIAKLDQNEELIRAIMER